MKFFISISTSFIIALIYGKSYASDYNSENRNNQQDSIVNNAVIDVEYNTTGSSTIDWNVEIEQARVTHTLDNKGIRITLPNADPAKVIIANKKGTKVLKTISYIAPAVIDISKLRKGQYQLVIELHGVVAVKTFEKKSNCNWFKKKEDKML